MRFKGKDSRLYTEFEREIARPLREVLIELDKIAKLQAEDNDNLVGGLIITCLIRTEAENVAVGGVKNSKHLTGRAADISTACFTQTELSYIVNSLKWHNAIVPYHAKGFVHEGTATHLHIEISDEFPGLPDFKLDERDV